MCYSKQIKMPETKHAIYDYVFLNRSWWRRGLRCGSVAAHLLGMRIRILLGGWMSVSCECCVLSGRGLCDRPISRPEETYRVCVSLSVIKCNNNLYTYNE
jgi:hypothetical protein